MEGELFIIDRKSYNSMMVPVLLDEPAKFEEHFELVMDRAPWVRVYRAKCPPGTHYTVRA